jgi:hypothetical protein
MQIGIQEAKAPWVQFERRAVEDRNASIEAGHYVAKDVDFVMITPYGSKDMIDRVAAEWFEAMAKEVEQQRYPQEWLTAFKNKFAAWKEGKETPLEGTSLLNWPVISPSQLLNCQALHILTVEQLAGANEEVLKRLGMGGRSLVDKAKDYLATAKGSGKVVEEIGALRQKTEQLTGQVAALIKANQTLLSLVPKESQADGQAAVEEASAAMGLNDLIDPPTTGLKKL